MLPTRCHQHPMLEDHTQQSSEQLDQLSDRILRAVGIEVSVRLPQLEQQFDLPANPIHGMHRFGVERRSRYLLAIDEMRGTGRLFVPID